MTLFSNRHRDYALGPYPVERLARTHGGDEAPAAAWPDLNVGDSDGLDAATGAMVASIGHYQRLFGDLRDGPVAERRAEIEASPRRFADNLKASAYFLDASVAGICRLPEGAWRDGSPPQGSEAHRFAVVILVEDRVAPRPGGPGDGWMRGGQRARGILHGGEIACTLAGYLRQLGYGARAHFGSASEVVVEPLVVAAGLGRPDRAGRHVVNPFLGMAYTAVAVTTELELEPDLPLAPVGGDRALRVRHPGHWLGWWGGRPGWKRLRGDHRPAHLGRFPMERLKRRERPTTFISDQVPRVPIRGSFFNRALMGDLGPRMRHERTRFALKQPFAGAMSPVFASMVPHQDGPVAERPAGGLDDPRANAQAVKAACHFMGTDVTGICEAVEHAWYSHDPNGDPIAVAHQYAIVILIDQGYETMDGASGDDWISGAQSMRAYLRGAEITGVIARHIRSLGYEARAHTNIKSDVLHIPLILQAGLGELSRIGELVLNPFVGPRFKSAVITTNLPLEVDRPIDFGLQDFCDKCLKCARECPCDAIPWGGKKMFNGYEMWKPDAEKCAKYRISNLKGSACGRCMKMCPYNTEGLLRHRWCLWLATHVPILRRGLAHLDDWLGNGRRNPVKRWWFDLELVDGAAVRPKGANERDLRLDFVADPARQKIAHYPADMNPPPGAKEPVIPDRAEALLRGERAPAPPPAR